MFLILKYLYLRDDFINISRSVIYASADSICAKTNVDSMRMHLSCKTMVVIYCGSKKYRSEVVFDKILAAVPMIY